MTILNQFASSLKLSAYCALFLFFVAPCLGGGVKKASELASYTIEYLSDQDHFEVKENASNLSLRFRCGGLTNSLQRVKVYYKAEPYSEMAAPPARPGVDYEPVMGVLEFSRENTEGVIQIPLFDNVQRDGSRALIIRLSDATEAFPHTENYGYIRDDDITHLEQAIPAPTLGLRSITHIQPLNDGDLLLAGISLQEEFGGSYYSALRIRSDGSTKTTWGEGGRIAWHTARGFEHFDTATPRFFPDGRIWIEFFTHSPSQSWAYTLQYDENGKFDRQVEGRPYRDQAAVNQPQNGTLLKDGSILIVTAECSLMTIISQGQKQCLDNSQRKHFAIISADQAADRRIAIVREGTSGDHRFSTIYSPATGEQPWVDLQMNYRSAFSATANATWRAEGDLLIRALPPVLEPMVGVAKTLIIQDKSNPTVQLVRSGERASSVVVECTVRPYPGNLGVNAMQLSARFEAGSSTTELTLPLQPRFGTSPAMNYTVTIDQAPGMRLSDWRTTHLVVINDMPLRNDELRLYPTYSQPFPSIVRILRGQPGDAYKIYSGPDVTWGILGGRSSAESLVYIGPAGLAIDLIPAFYSGAGFYVPVPLQ